MAFTPEQLEELGSFIDGKIGPAMNNMFTARLGTVEKKLSTQFKETTESITKLLDEKIATLKPVALPDDPDGKPGKGRSKDDPELATLRAQLNSLTESNRIANARSTELRERDRQRNAKDTVRAHLAKAGIDGERFEGAYALLTYQRQIKLAEDQDSDEVFFVNHGEDMSVDVGLGEWLKTDAAKIYLPPSGVRGAGSRPGSKGPNGAQLTPEQIRANVAAALAEELGR